MTILEAGRKITADQIKAGHGPALAARLGIPLKPNRHGLACSCGKGPEACTCKLVPTPDAAKPQKYGVGHPALIGAVLALRNISDRMDRVEQIHRAKGMTPPSMTAQSTNQPSGFHEAPQGPHPNDIIAAASQRAAMHQAQMYAEKIDRSIEDSHQKKIDAEHRRLYGDPREPGHTEPPPDDRHQFMKFDSSVGAHSPKKRNAPNGGWCLCHTCRSQSDV
jgi:hypothetical protein